MLWRLIALTFVISFVSLVLTVQFGVEFGRDSYWHHHGIFFLLGALCFPRLTLLFSSVASGGIIWWLGWLFFPRLLIAILATIAYWYANPFLVLISWVVALGAEPTEKYVVKRRVERVRPIPPGQVIDI